jgi:hypothetical protein
MHSNSKCVEPHHKNSGDGIKLHKQDTTMEHPQSFLVPDSIHSKFLHAERDSNFTYSKYLDFLANFGDTNKFIVLPLEKFRKTFNRRKIIIGLRHDVDLDLNIAHRLSMVENNIGVKSSYYILHTAPYYLADANNMAVHNDSIIPTLQTMQNKLHHEIGWHNDLVTLQVVYNLDPIAYFHQELNWLRNNGLTITGTASHGSNYCYTYNYLNYYFFNEYKDHIVGQFKNNDSVIAGKNLIILKHASLKDFGLNYEAYFLNNNKYFSDAKFINGERWNPEQLDIKSLVPGDRVIILMHPIYYWSSGSKLTELASFSLPGQLNSTINPLDTTILVELPFGTNATKLKAEIRTSPKSSVWIGQKKLISGQSAVDFTKPVKLRIIAEDGLSHTDWTVKIKYIETHFLVYPNPSKGLVKIDLFNIVDPHSRMDLYNMNGQLQFSEELNQVRNFSYNRDLSKLPAGIYYFRLLTNGSQMVQRFLKN